MGGFLWEVYDRAQSAQCVYECLQNALRNRKTRPGVPARSVRFGWGLAAPFLTSPWVHIELDLGLGLGGVWWPAVLYLAL